MKPSAAFTLIELLVVIAILGMLAALITPLFGRIRAAANTTACLSNLRQIGFAVQLHVNENNGRLPALQNRNSTNQPLPAMDTVLLATGTVQRVFRCPSDKPRLFETTGTSYFWNFTVNGQDVNNLFSIIGGRESARIPLISDKEGFHFDLQDKVNVLYVDGHAAKELQFSTSLSP
jgi:prepilin-type N-terminal cleavage/methylation domain-containing protein/prepilin-type processing-associated H-X9-DG protein